MKKTVPFLQVPIFLGKFENFSSHHWSRNLYLKVRLRKTARLTFVTLQSNVTESAHRLQVNFHVFIHLSNKSGEMPTFGTKALCSLALASQVYSQNNDCMAQKIIGGQSINDGQPPFDAEWIVNINMGCGGSWINQETVLTAAHCFGSQPNAGNSYSLSEKDADGRKVHIADFTGDQVTIHQQYDDNTLVNDVAVIRLCGYTGNHAVVGLPAAMSTPNFPHFFVYGWGNRNPNAGGDYPDILHWVQTPTVDYSTCASNYNLGNEYNTNMIVCAGQEGIDSCQGARLS